MQDFKHKLYNYEAEPPAHIWDSINMELPIEDGSKKVVEIPAIRRRPKFIFYSLTAAASLIIILLISLFYHKSGNEHSLISATELQQNKDSIKLNNETLENIIKTSKDENVTPQTKSNIVSKVKKYITIAGPEGQPVKISPKVATLIVSADNEYPPKAVWNKKIEKWKQIMLTNTLSPTSTDFLDIVQTTPSIIDNNE